MINEEMNKRIHTGKNNANFDHTNGDNSGANKEIEYRKILKELGFEKPDNEPLTKQELCHIFVYMQEDSFIGS